MCLAGVVHTSAERIVETNGVALRVIEAGERGAPVVVLAHGFPELAYSWRHQIPVLAEAGYHVLAPDQRGYGGSSRPDAVEDYDIHALTGDLVALLDEVGAGAGGVHRPRLGRHGGMAHRAAASRPGPGGRPGSAFHPFPARAPARPNAGGRSSATTSTCCVSRSPASPTPRWKPTWRSRCAECSPG